LEVARSIFIGRRLPEFRQSITAVLRNGIFLAANGLELKAVLSTI
jgi:hypothetical protein